MLKKIIFCLIFLFAYGQSLAVGSFSLVQVNEEFAQEFIHCAESFDFPGESPEFENKELIPNIGQYVCDLIYKIKGNPTNQEIQEAVNRCTMAMGYENELLVTIDREND